METKTKELSREDKVDLALVSESIKFREDRDNITKESALAVEKWGFPCLKSATQLKWDIGTKVYYAWNGAVYKGTVYSVNPYDIYGIETLGGHDGLRTLIDGHRIYKNPRYALREAHEQMGDKLSKVLAPATVEKKE